MRTNKPLALLQAVQSVGWRGLTYPWMVSESAMRMMEAETVTGLEGEPTQESFLLSTGENINTHSRAGLIRQALPSGHSQTML